MRCWERSLRMSTMHSAWRGPMHVTSFQPFIAPNFCRHHSHQLHCAEQQLFMQASQDHWLMGQ
jgi:hypothetical protein